MNPFSGLPTDQSGGLAQRQDAFETFQEPGEGGIVLPGLEMERLEALLPEVLDEKDGQFTIKGAVQLEPRVISWRTGA